MAEWISVKDRLPENIRSVLVIAKELKMPTIAWYGNVKNIWHLTERDFCKNTNFVVTHWMPLPEPPKE